MSDYDGWFMAISTEAECPDCGEQVGPTSDLGELLKLVDEHLKGCAPE